MNSSYFAELRELMDSQKNYKSALKYGFAAYENQPLRLRQGSMLWKNPRE